MEGDNCLDAFAAAFNSSRARSRGHRSVRRHVGGTFLVQLRPQASDFLDELDAVVAKKGEVFNERREAVVSGCEGDQWRWLVEPGADRLQLFVAHLL